MSDIERGKEILQNLLTDDVIQIRPSDRERFMGEWRESMALIEQAARQATASGEVEPVGEIEHDYNLLKVRWYSHPKYGQFKTGDKVYVAHPPAKVPKKEALKAACTDFFYWWYNQPGSNTQQGFDEWFRDVGFSHFTTSTPATTPQPADNWIKCSERLPTEADADDSGKVWFRSRVTEPCLVEYTVFSENQKAAGVYWMPTGLKRPTSTPATTPEAEWVEWFGGDQPVPDGTIVELKLRGGCAGSYPAEKVDWKAAETSFDIISYRVVEPTDTPPQEQ